ncbi:ParM/StbA family protein [Romboutsia sp.]|uniref:ParM/StbA family protein n=1 Tax=Romboutsia sp. TaxID=1965302 RepID=UPI002C2FA24E|nr:ParM/StbA family protein [Romboutsia sp.]HSQ87766.1 ParM/StbA family protein [Romboutsia sp.]
MALKRKIVAVDSGAFNTKGKSNVGDVLYNTKYSPRHTDAGMLGENTYNTTINGKELTIGNTALRTDKREGKHTDIHIWSTLTSIALLRGDADEIILGYGESYNKYVQDEQKKAIQSRLLGRHKVEIQSENGKMETHEFEIVTVHVLPEGTGHILSNLKANLGVKYVFDWGGSTVNFLEVINGRPSENSISFPFGVHNVNAIVGDRISKAGLGTFSDSQIKDWVSNKCTNKDIQKIIDEVIDDQLYKIDDKLAGFNIDLHDYLEVSFTGGTTSLFDSQIRKHYACARIEQNCLTGNVQGFYEYMRLKYGSQAK